MADAAWLERFLRTDPRDVGCDEALAVLHEIVEATLRDPEAGERSYPGVLAHLRSCPPCGVDFDGLLAAVTAEGVTEVDG